MTTFLSLKISHWPLKTAESGQINDFLEEKNTFKTSLDVANNRFVEQFKKNWRSNRGLTYCNNHIASDVQEKIIKIKISGLPLKAAENQ